MRTIYIDSDFKRHITNDGTVTVVETALKKVGVVV